MKRVLHVGKFYPPVSGGMERVLETVCRASAGLVESHVLVAHTGRRTIEQEIRLDGGDASPGCVHVTRVGTLGSIGSVHVAPAFAAHLRRARADLIILHEPNPWALLSYALARPSAPLAMWYHSDVVRPKLQYALFYAPLATHVYGRADRIIVSSTALADHSATLGKYRDRVRVVPFGINPAQWRLTEEDRAQEDRIGSPFVLFAGRHVPYKGVDVLLRSLLHVGTDAVIVGDGPMRTEWERLASDLGLGGRVRFLGDVTDARLRVLMHSCAALVLPSVTRAEAFGYVQLEAMACGKPVISTDVPSGVSWVNQHTHTGLVVRAGDTRKLATAIDTLMSDAALRARMGEAARTRVDHEFTLARLRQRLEAFYQELGCGAEGHVREPGVGRRTA
jgi:glycosyltransferase involved in cell wall biosynthesis